MANTDDGKGFDMRDIESTLKRNPVYSSVGGASLLFLFAAVLIVKTRRRSGSSSGKDTLPFTAGFGSTRKFKRTKSWNNNNNDSSLNDSGEIKLMDNPIHWKKRHLEAQEVIREQAEVVARMQKQQTAKAIYEGYADGSNLHTPKKGGGKKKKAVFGGEKEEEEEEEEAVPASSSKQDKLSAAQLHVYDQFQTGTRKYSTSDPFQKPCV